MTATPETGTLVARWVVLDIEGTMTPTASVHRTLYDYARARLEPWIREHAGESEVSRTLDEVRELAGLAESAGVPEIVAVLHEWMDADHKASPLKALQGWIWQGGFASGELEMEFFDDVLPALRRWRDTGLRLAVFSSGSVTAQKSSFSNTVGGDVRELFEAHFDTTNAGPKKEPASYGSIADSLGAPAGELLFLSDVPAELDAARESGWWVAGLARAGEPFAEADFGTHTAVGSFDNIEVEALS